MILKKIHFSLIALGFTSLTACAQFNLGKTISNAEKSVTGTKSGSQPLSNDEVINGLKDALKVGTDTSTSAASKVDGFYKNAEIKIPFPPEAQKVENTANDLGMKDQVDKFVMTLNRAAEEATKNAAPVFLDAIKQMTVTDGFAILKGDSNAATKYLQDKTTAQLHDQFKPIVEAAINKVEVTKYWAPIINAYNNVPFVQKQNPDLNEYVTQQAMKGLFKLIADQELLIRKNPAARVDAILQRVFGSL
ncbi:MAG: DUF4197 domain-containing protein [Bacteroidia bacterium]